MKDKSTTEEEPVKASPSQDVFAFPASFAQRRLWFLDQLEPGSSFYNISVSTCLKGSLNVAALEKSLNEILRRHEALRTTFATVDGQPVQVIAEAARIEMPLIDLTGLKKRERPVKARELAKEEARRPFDLTRGPLVRALLIELDGDERVLVLTMHHIVSDGWSMGVLFRELTTLYGAFSEGQESPLAELPIQYADFAHWQREWLRGQVLERQLSYWREHLRGAPAVLELSTDRPRPSVQSFHGAKHPLMLSKKLSENLHELSRREKVTLFMTLVGAFQALLHRYIGQDDIVVGTDVANRNRAEIEGLIGFFVNQLVLRVDLSGNPTFRELLKRVKEMALGAYAHQDVPFEKLVEELQPERSLSRSPLFQIGFVLQNMPMQSLEFAGLSSSRLEIDNRHAKFDLTLFVVEEDQGLSCKFEYSTDLFNADTIVRMASHFQTLLEGIVTNPDQHLSDLPLLSEAECDQMLVEWNDTDADHSRQQCVHQLFEEQVERTPHAIAVAFENEQVTYAELNRRANQLAHYLQKLGVGPEALVGICVDRSVQMIIGLLGVLKAGGAYLPLDPAYPEQRLSFMLEDSCVSVLLTLEQLKTNLPVNNKRLVCLDRDWSEIASEIAENPVGGLTGENLAYVIYTSGSTGKPKGVMTTHRSLLNYTEAASAQYSLSSADRVLQFASMSFDASAEEIYPCLTRGGTLVLRTEFMIGSVSEFWQKCRDWALTVLDLPTAYWHELAARSDEDLLALPPSLRLVIIGGERAIPGRMAMWQKHFSESIRLVNTYGPTEATIVSTIYDVSDTPKPDGVLREVPIGRAIRNVQTYALDRHLKPVPIGVPGELYIGGEGLARGYLNRPELTAEKFIPNPFTTKSGARLYKSGDLVRYLSDGNLEFLGRVDDQIKIRGFRIELGEIEQALNEHDAVREVVIAANEDESGFKRLVAYVVPNPESNGGPEQGTELQAERVSEWEAVFDDLYSEFDPENEAQFYVKGWDSSYTGRAIPKEEVDEWMRHTVERILSLKPDRVREIGCGGSGLMLFRIAPFCQEYYATDVSRNALSILQRQLDGLEHEIPGVTIQPRAADDFRDVAPNSLDAVLIVSVTQYFPSIAYLMKVLENAVNAVQPGGFIFLGDLRSMPLLEAFHASVQLSRAPSSLTTSELKGSIKRELLFEKQLTVDPDFFSALKEHLPKISNVQIQLLRGRCHNELTKFRYDVVLHVGKDSHTNKKIPWLDWQEQGFTLETVRQLLIESEPDLVGLTRVPNARVSAELQMLKLLQSDDEPTTAGDLRTAIQETEGAGVDPEELWAIEAELPYSVNISWSGSGKDGCYDVVFTRKTGGLVLSKPATSFFRAEHVRNKAWRDYANDTTRRVDHHKVVPQLRNYLKEKLPDYMMPSAFVLLDKLPMTASGKVDHQALPAPNRSRSEMEDSFVAPNTPAEKTLAEIWAGVLGLEKVSVRDNFFELGGDSILSIQIIARASQAGLQLVPKQIFQHQTIAELAAVAGSTVAIEVDQGTVLGTVPLTPIQHWFFEQNLQEPHHFNQARLLEARQALDPTILEGAVGHILAHHDALRLRYVKDDAGWQQSNAGFDGAVPFERIDLSEMSEAEQVAALEDKAARLQASLNLMEGPLVRVALFDLGLQRNNRLLVVIHHLAVDGVSWRILLEDLQAAYRQLKGGQRVNLPRKTTPFKQWAERLNEYSQSEGLVQEANYWLAEARTKVGRLPVDQPEGVNTVESTRTFSVSLNVEDTQALLQEVPAAYGTQINDVLLTALVQVLVRWSGEQQHLVDLEGHGREDVVDGVDLTRTVGWFTTVFPVLIKLENGFAPGEALKSIKEQLRGVPHRGIGYGLLRYMGRSAKTTEKLRALPPAEVSFNYFGQFDQLLSASSLFETAPERKGSVRSLRQSQSHLLGIDGLIVGGRLRLDWTYSECIHKLSTIEGLAHGFIETLKLLIAHCQAPEAGGYTPSDFPEAALSQEQLDSLLAEIDLS